MKAGRGGLGSGGFMVVELLVAVLLVSLVVAALAAFEQSALRSQSSTMNKTLLGNNATMAGQAIRNALASASYVALPAPGAASTSLLSGENVDPSDGSSPLVPFLGQTFNYLCADSGQALYLYQGAWPMPGILCGASPPLGVSRVLVAGKTTGLSVSPYFYRPVANEVQAAYTINLTPAAAPAMTISHATQINLPNPVNWP